MNDERLSQLLRALPREQAGPHFTAAVLRRIAAERPRPLRRLGLAASLAAALAAAVFGGRFALDEARQRSERRAALARLSALEAERQALAAELASLRRLARAARPIVYLDSSAEVDLVLDLSRLARSSQPTGSTLEPGSDLAAPIRPLNASSPKGVDRP